MCARWPRLACAKSVGTRHALEWFGPSLCKGLPFAIFFKFLVTWLLRLERLSDRSQLRIRVLIISRLDRIASLSARGRDPI
jgi:hypothetical protein